MIRASTLRALVLTAAVAMAFTPVTSLGQSSNRLPAKATKPLPPALLSLLRQKKMPVDSPILVRVFKEESELEVWKQDTTGRFHLLKTYPICRWSGDLGPKLQEGDGQTPEGFYRVTPELMNPHSNYYLSMNIGYPNAFDKANNRDGSLIMIHGDCWSVGCYAMTDEQISEVYALARESFLGGHSSFQVQTYPFRMTPANLARHRNNPNLAFWKMLKTGNDHFETTQIEPKVDVCNRRYVFNAQRSPNSPTPLVFNPADKCPAFAVNPKIERRAREKQRADELEYARLLEDKVPAAAIYSELDGGMNKVFFARFAERLTFSKRVSLDLAKYPVELFMEMHARDGQGVRPEGASTHGNLAPLIYTPWAKFCPKAPDADTQQVCFTGRQARSETGMPAVAVALIEPEGALRKILRVTLPGKLQLQYGARIVLDQEQPLASPFFTCFANGCMADYEGTPDLIDKLKKGNVLHVQAIKVDGAQISFPVSLDAFAKANEGSPAEPRQ